MLNILFNLGRICGPTAFGSMRARVAGLGGLLLSVLLVQAQALPWPYNNVPSLSSLENAICGLYGEDPLPFAANNFCNGTGFTKPDQSGYLCDILGYAEHTLQAFASGNATCPAARQTRAATVSRNGVPIPYPLSDMRPLPVNLPASLLSTEGPSMYWHWKNLYNFEDYLRRQRKSARVKVDAYLFAPPSAGDSTWVAGFNAMVNARRIPFIYDLVPQVPCTPTMTSCNNTVVPTTNPTGVWQYSTVGGTLQLLPSGMPNQAAQWALFDDIYPCQLAGFATATHICSYNCYFSQFANDIHNSCLLWNTTSAGGVGTYCQGYPVTSGPQYPYA